MAAAISTVCAASGGIGLAIFTSVIEISEPVSVAEKNVVGWLQRFVHLWTYISVQMFAIFAGGAPPGLRVSASIITTIWCPLAYHYIEHGEGRHRTFVNIGMIVTYVVLACLIVGFGNPLVQFDVINCAVATVVYAGVMWVGRPQGSRTRFSKGFEMTEYCAVPTLSQPLLRF